MCSRCMFVSDNFAPDELLGLAVQLHNCASLHFRRVSAHLSGFGRTRRPNARKHLAILLTRLSDAETVDLVY